MLVSLKKKKKKLTSYQNLHYTYRNKYKYIHIHVSMYSVYDINGRSGMYVCMVYVSVYAYACM